MLGVHYVKSEASNCFYSVHLGAIALVGKDRKKTLPSENCDQGKITRNY